MSESVLPKRFAAVFWCQVRSMSNAGRWKDAMWWQALHSCIKVLYSCRLSNQFAEPPPRNAAGDRAKAEVRFWSWRQILRCFPRRNAPWRNHWQCKFCFLSLLPIILCDVTCKIAVMLSDTGVNYLLQSQWWCSIEWKSATAKTSRAKPSSFNRKLWMYNRSKSCFLSWQ